MNNCVTKSITTFDSLGIQTNQSNLSHLIELLREEAGCRITTIENKFREHSAFADLHEALHLRLARQFTVRLMDIAGGLQTKQC